MHIAARSSPELIVAKGNADNAQNAAADALQQAKTVRDTVRKQRADVESADQEIHRLAGDIERPAAGGIPRPQRANHGSIGHDYRSARRRLRSRPLRPAVGGGSAKAQTAVAYARAQLGKPYVFGAAGPDAFDCSGLTMMAWAAAGVSLPHYAPSQMQSGSVVPIDVSAMLPGDLIFLYPDVGHVEIYAGNGMAISAPSQETW